MSHNSKKFQGLIEKIDSLGSFIEDLRSRDTETNDELFAVIDQIEHPCISIGSHFQIEYCNLQGAELLGKKRSELYGVSLSECLPEESEILSLLKKSRNIQQTFSDEVTNPFNQIGRNRIRLNILHFPKRALLIIKHRLQDHIGLQALLKDLPDLIFLIDKKGIYLDYFVKAPLKLSFQPNEFIGKNMAELPLPEELKSKIINMISEVLESGSSQLFEYEIETVSGPKWFEGKILPAGRGEVYFISRDISEKKEREQTIISQQSLLSTLLQSSPVIIWTIDSEGLFTLSEGMGLEQIGLKPGQIVGMSYKDLYSDYPEVIRMIERGFEGETGRKVVRFSGLTYEIRYFPQKYPDGKVKELMGISFEITAQEKTLKALQESEEKFRAIFNDAPIGIFRSTPDGKFIEVNPALANMLGYDNPAQVIEEINNIAEDIYVEPQKRNYLLNQINESDQTVQLENLYRRKDGKNFTANLYLNKITDEHGEVRFLEGIIEDITLRKQAEEQLRESEERFRLLFNNVQDIAMQGYKQDGRVHYWNKGSEKLYGYSAEEAIGKNLLDLIIPSPMKNEVAKAIARMFVTGATREAEELNLLHKNGYLVHVLSNHTIVDIPGRGKELFCIDIDLAKLKKAENALRESEKKYRLLVEHQSDLIVKVDPEGNFLFVSPSYCKFFGLSEEEVKQKPFQDFVYPDDLENTRKEMLKLLDPPHTCYIEQRALTHNGIRWIGWSDNALLNSEGELESIIGVGRDITKRKEAESALSQSEQRYRTLVEQNPSAIYILEGLNCIYANSAGFALLGYSQEKDLLQANFLDHIAPEYRDAWKNIENTGEKYPGENLRVLRFLRKDGIPVFVEVNSFPIIYGEQTATMILAQNITERIRMEKELRKSERRLKEAQQAGKFAHFDMDRESGIITFSESAYTILSLNSSVRFLTLGQALKLFKKEERIPLYKMGADVFRNKTPHQYVALHINDAHEKIYISVQTFPVMDSKAEVTGIKGVIQDITESKVIEGQLREHRAALARANELALLGTYHVDIRNNIVSWSHELKQLIPFEEEINTMEDLINRIHPQDRHILQRANESFKLLGDKYQFEYRLIHPNERIQYVVDRGEISCDRLGNPVAAFGTMQDITEMKIIENELRKVNEAKDKFFSIIAHDLKTPFTGLLGISDYLSKNADIADPEEIKNFAGKLHRETSNIYSLIENLLHWSRLQTGRIVVEKKTFDLSRLIEKISAYTDILLKQKQITIEILPETKIELTADLFMIETILRNLLTNAVKFTPNGGKIVVGVNRLHNGIEIFVKDNGIGITEKRQERLFKVGEKVNTLGTDNKKGTGLGLILCKEFAELHNGSIRVESMENAGSTFYVFLPDPAE